MAGTGSRTTGASLSGVAAIALWSTLATMTAAVGPIPPFELAALTFAIGTLASALAYRLRGQSLAPLLRTPAAAIALGVAGLLGYHVCYFYALQTAPAVEANLINYLWPLLIVLFAGLLPAAVGGHSLQRHEVVGAALGFAGTGFVILSGPAGLTFSGNLSGYLAALAAALTWAAYSVASRLLLHVPSVTVILSCALTALGAAVLHIATEPTVVPRDAWGWLLLAIMGIGPVGLAFPLWDHGMKHGDVRLLGVLSYATPIASTALLALTGWGQAGPLAWAGALLVSAGALIASWPRLRNAKRAP